MTNNFTIEQFDADINALLAGGVPLPAPREAEAVAMLAVAEDLTLAPRAEFKQELRARLGQSPVAFRKADASPLLFQNSELSFPANKNKMAASAGLHALLMTVFVMSGVMSWRNEAPRVKPDSYRLVTTDVIMPISNEPASGGGGGGNRSKVEASRGELPKFAESQVTPPTVVVKNPDPKLAVEPTVMLPQVTQVPTSDVGDPLSKGLAASNGMGMRAGIGTGDGGGIGPGKGPGIGIGAGGGVGGGIYRAGSGGVSSPRAISTPDPEYSEEARKAKVQGVVTLYAVIGPDGRPRDLRVMRALGMGLDEKALEAVRNWRFEPAKKDGQAVSVMVNIEVRFSLY